jgi:thymidylate synthase ThyX
MQSDRASISAQVIADSIHDGSRLTTFEVTFPRFILAEFNTHRVLSRNSASSRAIPVWKRLTDIIMNPFVPLSFGKNKAGMQSAEEVAEEDGEAARKNWLVGRDVSVIQSFMLAGGEKQIMKDSKDDPRAAIMCRRVKELELDYPDVTRKMRSLSAGVHKQHANRVVEPYAYHTVIVTGTSWRNFYALRASPMAQPEIQEVAIAMARVHSASIPRELDHNGWHHPYIFDEDREEIKDNLKLARISSSRCGRVSYLTHDGKRSLDKDFSMADDLQGHGHMSPFEHPATTRDTTGAYHGNFHGNFSRCWMQYRKMLENEHDFSQFISEDVLLGGMKGDRKLVDFVLSLNEFHP